MKQKNIIRKVGSKCNAKKKWLDLVIIAPAVTIKIWLLRRQLLALLRRREGERERETQRVFAMWYEESCESMLDLTLRKWLLESSGNGTSSFFLLNLTTMVEQLIKTKRQGCCSCYTQMCHVNAYSFVPRQYILYMYMNRRYCSSRHGLFSV